MNKEFFFCKTFDVCLTISFKLLSVFMFYLIFNISSTHVEALIFASFNINFQTTHTLTLLLLYIKIINKIKLFMHNYLNNF